MVNREGRESLTEKRTFHANPEGGEEANHADPQGEHSSRGNGKGKGPEAGPCLACLRTCWEAGVGRAGGVRPDTRPDRARPCAPSLDSSLD